MGVEVLVELFTGVLLLLVVGLHDRSPRREVGRPFEPFEARLVQFPLINQPHELSDGIGGSSEEQLLAAVTQFAHLERVRLTCWTTGKGEEMCGRV